MAFVRICGKVLSLWEIPGTSKEATRIATAWALANNELNGGRPDVLAWDKRPEGVLHFAKWQFLTPDEVVLLEAQKRCPYSLFVASCAGYFRNNGRLTPKQVEALRLVEAPSEYTPTPSYYGREEQTSRRAYSRRNANYQPVDDSGDDFDFGAYEGFGW